MPSIVAIVRLVGELEHVSGVARRVGDMDVTCARVPNGSSVRGSQQLSEAIN